MIGLLQSIVDFFVCWVQTGATLVVNALVAAVGALVSLLVAADPIGMPDPPVLPDEVEQVLGWVAWVFPVGTAIDILLFFVTAWLGWQVIAIALRWAKAL